MQPRSDAIRYFSNRVSRSIYGMTIDEAHEKGICVSCKKPITDVPFKDELSRIEYQISSLCQTCQDDVFAEDDDE